MLPSLLASLLLLFCGGESIKIQTQNLNRIETTYRSKLIERANNKLFNFKAAKNVILFLVEGLDSHTMSAARKIFNQLGETSIDNINELDTYVTGFLKPQSRDSMVADIAAASSAIFNGLPERNGQMGWVEQENATCGEFDPAKKLLPNLFKLMSQAGKYTALVTNSRLTSPGVAGTYASSPDMQVESDIHLKESGCDDKRFKDIAKQLLTNQDLNVIIGSGRNYFIKNSTLVSLPLSRSDIDLTKLWQMNKILKKRTSSKVVEGKLQILQHLSNPANHDLVGFLQTPESYPELGSYLQDLISFFNQKKDSKGYFIVAHTDHLALIHQATTAYRLGKMVNAILSDINTANKFTKIRDDTLIVVTSTQGSTLTVSSGSLLNEELEGVAQTEYCEPYTMLNYAFGPKTSVNYSIPVENKWSNQFQSLHESETITGGPDLPIFATGPGAPAFSGINSLSYVYHALVFATCLANNSTYPHCKAAPPPTTTTFKPQTTAGMLTTRKPVPTPSTPPPTLKPIPQTPRPLPSWPWLIQPQQQYNPNPYSNLGDSFLNSLGNVRPMQPWQPMPPMQPMQPWQPMPPMQPVTPTPPPAQNNNPWAWASLFPFFF